LWHCTPLDADVRFTKASYDLSRDCHLEPLAYSYPTGYGHDGERQAWLLTGAELDNQEAASRVQPQTAFLRPSSQPIADSQIYSHHSHLEQNANNLKRRKLSQVAHA
jgi:hypothetical protein